MENASEDLLNAIAKALDPLPIDDVVRLEIHVKKGRSGWEVTVDPEVVFLDKRRREN